MTDIKSLLKEARKLIDDKNFKEAQECCKNILRKDKQNYFGLVLLGKSLQDSDQAPLAYQKAIACKRDNPLAWQGLSHFYESKNDDISKRKLLNIYNEMLYLPVEEDKTLETITKLGQLGCIMKNSETITALANFINKNEAHKLNKAAEAQLLELLKVDVPCEEKDIPLVFELLVKMYLEVPSDYLELIQCKVILQRNNLKCAVEELIKLPFFSTNVELREFLCKWLCTKYMETMSFNEIDVEKQLDVITQNIENSKYPSLLKCMVAYDKGLFLDAYKQCVPLINYQEPDVTEATFIIRCTMMLNKWSVTQKLATNFITKVSTEKIANDLRKFLFVSLAKQQKWKQAIANVKLVPLDLLSMDEKVCLAECYIETNNPVEDIMEDLKETENYVELQALLLLKQEKYVEVISLLQSPENAILIFYLSKAYWELKEYDKSFINLLKAAKLNPDHAETFLYLGHFYYYQKNDLCKAKKCYEKAYNLSMVDIIIAKSLSDTYSKLQESDADFDLLVSLNKKLSTAEPWINFRLGLHYLNRRDWENAIINFRNVIKTNQNNTTAFQCLADAYYSRGSYTSALRAYNKVMTMDPQKASHCLTKIGYIHSLLTQYDDAISTFEKVLKYDPSSYLALKGIAETWIRIARKKVSAKLHGSARDCAQSAINYIIKAVQKQNQFTCFWKLLADTLIFVTKLPDQYAYAYMPDLSKNSASKLIKKEKVEIFPLAIACYSYVTKQKQQVTSYDLAYAYFCFYQESRKVVNAHISYNLITVCIKEKPNCWRNWNLLGKICLLIKRYELSQHCFIKALNVSRKWSVAKIWCNLGTLYLKVKLYKLSNYCFWRGQSTMPSYPQSWIGQALIAESIREEESMDLFRHASRLGYHPESALGYADWVCRTLKDNKYSEDAELKYVIEGLYAIPYAMDLIEWFCNFEPNNACACNILGVLQECSGHFMPAMKSYEKAFKNGDDNQKNIVLLNIGRLLVRLEKFEEAVKVYKAITEASFNSTIGLALALFKNGKYEESYSGYDTALHWLCGDENEKADVLVAMAGIVYMYKGMDDAKTILFHSIQTSHATPTPYSLYSICALGLTHSEQSMSKLAISELQKFNKDSQYGFDIGFLHSYYFVLEGNIDQAIKVLSDSLHDHPNNALLWFCMVQYCLRMPDSKAKSASCCAQRALCAAQFGDSNINLADVIASASIAEHLAGDHKKGLLLAKEGLHMYPNQAEIWAALLFSLLSNRIWMEKKTWLLTATGHVRRNLKISRPLSRWVSLLEKKLSR